ncbi:MAG: hypothetical protein GY822_29990 [Deltaproteobacteria bacterium]|nr:hypothetical protein [Deltaproteobacteria bacterium]
MKSKFEVGVASVPDREEPVVEFLIAQYNWCTFFEGESPGLGQMRSSKSG